MQKSRGALDMWGSLCTTALCTCGKENNHYSQQSCTLWIIWFSTQKMDSDNLLLLWSLHYEYRWGGKKVAVDGLHDGIECMWVLTGCGRYTDKAIELFGLLWGCVCVCVRERERGGMASVIYTKTQKAISVHPFWGRPRDFPAIKSLHTVIMCIDINYISIA